MVDFQAKALPDHSSQQIYKGFVGIKRKILFLFTVNSAITNRTVNAQSYMLPLDTAPGGLASFAGGGGIGLPSGLSNIIKVSSVCFIPTVSALDIGSGNSSINTAQLNSAYTIDNPPSSPYNTPFNNFVTAVGNNEEHLTFGPRNGDFLLKELSGTTSGFGSCALFCNSSNLISGPASLCSSGNFSVNGLPAGTNVTWSVSGPIAISGSTTGNTVTIVQNGNGSGTLTASITSTCSSAVVINKTIDAGFPMPSYISILQQSCLGGSDWEVTFQAVPAITNGQYIWVYNGVDMPTTIGSNFYIYASLATSVNINLKIKNACGTSANLYSSDATFYSPCNGSRFAVFPNPAGNSMTITTSSANSSSADATKSSSTNSTSTASNAKRSFSYKIYNKTGKILKQGSSSGKDVIVDTQDLASDNYFLHVLIGKQEIQKQIIIKH